jgi:hypothetical protein
MRSMSAAYQVDDRDARIAALEAEVAALRPFAPPKPPENWVPVKTAAHLVHRSEQLVYKWRRCGKLESISVRGRIWINPNSLPIV